jgi:hypothetical protein
VLWSVDMVDYWLFISRSATYYNHCTSSTRSPVHHLHPSINKPAGMNDKPDARVGREQWGMMGENRYSPSPWGSP